MDRVRSRKPTLKTQPSLVAKAMREDFKPAVEWSEDASSHTLLVLLPGFKREEIRVQIDNVGRLLVKGSRQASENKVLVVDQSFAVPEGTNVEMISGRFDDGRLTLVMPRKVVKEEEAIQKATTEEKGKEGKKEEESVEKEAKSSEERKDEPMKEKPTSHEEKKNELTQKEKLKSMEEETLKEKPTSHEEKNNQLTRKETRKSMDDDKDQETQKEKPASHEEKKNELSRKEKAKSVEDDKDQETQKEMPKTEGEKKDDSPVLEEKPPSGEEKKDEAVEKEKSESVEEEKKEDSIQTEKAIFTATERVKEERTIEKMKSKNREICADKPKEIQKKISNWRGVKGSRLDSGSFDGMLEKLNRNKKVIAVVVVALSVGFFVSHKLRTRGR